MPTAKRGARGCEKRGKQGKRRNEVIDQGSALFERSSEQE
jgi:hypothetical protein